nr:phasin family protein [Gammaproteobacteria bacterium]
MEKLFVEVYTQINELNENVIQPAYRLKEIAHMSEGKLIEQHLALVEACLEVVIRQLKALGESNDIGELVDRQATLAASWRDEVLALGHAMQQTSEQATY